MSWTVTSISQLNAILPGHFQAYIAVSVPTSQYFWIPGIFSDSRTSFHASDTRENHNIQQILTHLL